VERFHGNGKKDAGGGRSKRALRGRERGMARQESILRESKVFYIERRKKRGKRKDRRERGRKVENGGRTNAVRKEKERERRKKRHDVGEKKRHEGDPRRRS